MALWTMGYVRRDDSDSLIVLANNSETAQEVSLSLGPLNVDAKKLTDLVNGVACTIKDGVATVTVPALSGVIPDDGKDNGKTEDKDNNKHSNTIVVKVDWDEKVDEASRCHGSPGSPAG